MSDNTSVDVETSETAYEPPAFDEWIQATLAIIEHPATSGGVFCPQWWKHPEAVARFRALHQQYVRSQQQGEMSDWWVHHWDLHAKSLFDPRTGVFRDCASGHRAGDDPRIREVSGKEAESPEFLDITATGSPDWV